MTEPQKHAAASIHKEFILEEHLVSRLVQDQEYQERSPDAYDRGLALDKALVLSLVQETQPDEWRKMKAQYSTAAEAEFFKQLEKALKQRGTLDVLRQGLKLIPGIRIRFCYFQPASGLNPDLVRHYRANVLSVMRQVRYSQKNENAIDVVLFVNGFPVATLEIKNPLTGSTFRHAEAQYRSDRAPAGEPLLTFSRGALVHFALDDDNVSMTTRLQNGQDALPAVQPGTRRWGRQPGRAGRVPRRLPLPGPAGGRRPYSGGRSGLASSGASCTWRPPTGKKP